VISRSRLLGALCAAACLAAAFLATPALAAKPAWSPVAASLPTNVPPVQSETQRLGVDAEDGTFKLVFGSGGPGISETEGLDFDVPPFGGVGPTASVQNALNTLTNIKTGTGTGSVTVRGGPGNTNAENPYFITFDGGSLANTDVAQLSTDASSLTGTSHSASLITTVPGGAGTTMIAIYAQNIGGISTSGTITASVTLPAGVKTSGTPEGLPGVPNPWSCSPGAQQNFTCTTIATVGAGLAASVIQAPVVTSAGAAGTKPVKVEVEGGGAMAPASFSMPLTVSSTPAEPGIQTFTAGAYDENGKLDTRAGGHPYTGSTAILLNTYRNSHGAVVPVGEFKNIEVDLPPGFLGNPIATPECPESELSNDTCKAETIIGTAAPMITNPGGLAARTPVYNVQAPFGYPGKFFFELPGVPIAAVGSLRSDGDYGLTVGSLNTAQLVVVYGSFFTFWGTPADSSHDNQRCVTPIGGFSENCITSVESKAPKTAFITNPTNCAEEAMTPPVTRLRVTTWQAPLVTHTASVGIEPVTGCDQLKFEVEDFTFKPSETKSDSPASFETELAVPSKGLTTPSELTTPEIKKTVIQLPKGVVLNASGADGLQACSEAQIGLKNEIDPATGLPIPLAMPNPIRFTKDPNTCPDASKVGTGELKTALLTDPLKGNLYLAAQGKGNPFGSLFAIYLVIEDPRHGVFIKLPGKVEPDGQTGQMTVTFDNLPQLPFTSLKLALKGGNRSALASPTTCGHYLTTMTNTPWSAPESGPPTETSNGFEINQGPNGQPCAPTPQARPFDLGWSAGSTSPTAGTHSPVSLRVTRPDGAQELDSLELATPPGLTASLKGIPYCTAPNAQIEARDGKAEQASPTCPPASQVGTTLTGAGSGPTPFYTPGKLYLAGPYKGAPLSVIAVTPALAGPFDLGNVVVRSAVYVNPETAQITAKTDPIPQVLDGVVLRIRDVRINLDRKDWTLNPTSCEPLSIDLTAHGNSGASANLKTRFQVGGCDKLAFKPKMALKLKGGTKRNDNPALTATLRYPDGPGYANTRSVAVTLPHSEFLDQSHIRTVCTRVQFAAKACPAGSIYGKATAITPLLDQPLSGPVYLRSSDNKLPDLVIALKGPPSQPIEVVLDGRIDSIKGGIRNSFELVPDAPVSKFTLEMQGGKKGLLVNSRNLCTAPSRTTVRLIAQNNKRADQFPLMQNQCAKKHKRSKKHSKRSRQRSWLSKLVAGW
jgi:hypothetical protein